MNYNKNVNNNNNNNNNNHDNNHDNNHNHNHNRNRNRNRSRNHNRNHSNNSNNNHNATLLHEGKCFEEKEEEGESNVNLYPDLERIKEDGQRKYLNRNNNKKKMSFIRSDPDFEKFVKFCLSKPELLKDFFGRCDSSTNSSKICYPNRHPKCFEKTNKKLKKTSKKSKKHAIKNENFLNKSSLRNIY